MQWVFYLFLRYESCGAVPFQKGTLLYLKGTNMYHQGTNMHPLGTKVYLLKRYRPSDSFRTFFSVYGHAVAPHIT